MTETGIILSAEWLADKERAINAHQNHAIVTVDPLTIDESELTLEVWQYDVDRRYGEQRPAYAYEVRLAGLVMSYGNDLYGPNAGVWPEADEMAVTLASFLSYDTERGEGDEIPTWLHEHAERLSLWAYDMEHANDAS